MSELEGQCEVCQEPCKLKCSQCKCANYCSAEHQKEDWVNHKINCIPYEICSNQELGRFLIAKRDLEPDDVIFVDAPLVFGPKPDKIEDGPFPCVGCGKVLSERIHVCPECFWPVCSPECNGLKSPQIHGLECQILKLAVPAQNGSIYDRYRFDTLIVLRALFLQKWNRKKWDALLSLEDHLDDRGPGSEVFQTVQEKVAYIQTHFIAPFQAYEKETGQTILPQVSGDIMHKIYATLDVNATETANYFVLYPTASLLEHNCLPNTYQIINESDDYKITFRAALPIKKGEHVTSTYTNILWGTQERRKHLKETKYFSCTCLRCKDPTELGTFFSALVCLGTEEEPCKGTQLPVNPLDDNSSWLCDKCGIKLPGHGLNEFVNHLSKEVNNIIEKKPKLEELEEFLGKLEIFLHSNHFLVYTIKHTLVQLYRIEGDIEISDNFIAAKLKLCEELIGITKKLDPGNSRLALYLAVLLNEQFTAKFKLLTRNFSPENKQLSKDDIKELQKISMENERVLKHEQQSEAGSKLLDVVKLHDLNLKNWLKDNQIEEC